MIIMVKIEHAQTVIEADKLELLKLLVAVEMNTVEMTTKDAVYRAIEYYIEKHQGKKKRHE